MAIVGAAALVPGTAAQASASGRPSAPVPAGKFDVLPKPKQDVKIPAGARRLTSGQKPTVGASGPAFQRPTSTRSAASPRIIGGQLADPRNYPGVVGIQTYFAEGTPDGGWTYWVSTCTGTVLSPTKVLTAGHCTVGFTGATSFVIAGRQNLDDRSSGFVARVSAVWTHQGFNYAAANAGRAAPVDDVAVLTLKDPLPAVYTPVTLTAQGDQSPYVAGTQAKIAGYGVTSNTVNNAGTLYEATVPMQSDTTCANTFGSSYDKNRMICAGVAGTVDSCHGDSGGPIFVNGLQAGIVDWGHDPCASDYGVYERLSYYADAIKQDFTRPDVVNLDWTGDGHSDLFARTAQGELLEYDGSGLASDGSGGFAPYVATWGTGWSGYNKMFRVSNWNGDGNPAIFARDGSGRLYQFKGDGMAGMYDPIQVGNGWNSFTDIMVTNNWTGDGRPNLMGRNAKGDLYLYTSDGKGGWLNNGIGIKIGVGWNNFNTVLTPGTWDGDGHQTLIGRNSAGDLLLYKSDGNGGWLNNGIGVKIGTGWGTFRVFMSPGDWSGDRQVDLLGVNAAGTLLLYKTDGRGKWLNGGNGQTIGGGWNAFNAVF
ncbi:hypothetical protein GCM10027605_07640 [Micromonospora zhanjiangensis]